jgi:hypothetical protein
MKKAFLILSLLGNGVLAAIYVQRLRSHATEDAEAQKNVASAPVVRPPTFISLDNKAWESLRSGSSTELVARLRAEGFPREMIASIVDFRLNEEFAERRAAILALRKPIEFWKYRKPSGYGPETGLDAPGRAQLRALNDEKAKLRRDLLGGDSGSPDEAAYRKRQFGDLPEETARGIEAINKDYRELSTQAREEMQGILLPSDREKFKFLEKERQADVAALMTPEELADYNLRSSLTATQLQFRLSAFKPSESEYKQIYSLQRAFDDQYGIGDLTPDEEKRREDARSLLLEQVKTALGPDRFSEYQITTDPAYRSTQYFVNGSGLPSETAGQLVSIQREITQKVSTVKNDTALSPEQRDAQLLTLSLQANAQLTTVLGAEALPRYKNSIGGWVNRIQPARGGTH